MPKSNAARIVDDLFFEQEVEVLATNYKHGVLRSVAVLGRSLLFSRAASAGETSIPSGSSVAVVFFPNEFEAMRAAPAGMPRVDRILRLDLHALSIVRHTLGLRGLAAQSARFLRMALRAKGPGCIGRLTYPLLGWLLYQTFRALLVDKAGVHMVTTNMQHPLSIGVAWAAIDSGQAADFYEHATTPRLVFNDRGYGAYFVQFEHTGRMLVEQGVDPARVHVLQPIAIAAAGVADPIRAVGVCVNILDSLESIADVSAVLREKGLDVTYRVHDADPRLAQLRLLAMREKAGLSNARESRIQAFLETVDLVIVGNSNVIADALVAGRRVVYYWTGAESMLDYYGLVSHYSVPSAHDRESLRSAIDSLQPAAAAG